MRQCMVWVGHSSCSPIGEFLSVMYVSLFDVVSVLVLTVAPTDSLAITGFTHTHLLFHSLLGYSYYRGAGVQWNISKALEMGRLSAAQGLPNAQYFMGSILHTTDRGEAMKYLQDASQGGNEDAMYFIGCCQLDGGECVHSKSSQSFNLNYNICMLQQRTCRGM